ncbi:MAG: 50S ribosomal protein L11 methyltransferase [Deltaproteobacteria bacterium]|nr:50S ribosomal protein L11 methyltransferase [Deltaproteobacteria bacterium]
MPAPETRVPPTAWIEAIFFPPDSQTARGLVRELKRAGAARVWQAERRVLSLWPDAPASRAALKAWADLETPPRVRELVLRDPGREWAPAPLVEPGPGLRLAPAWGGAVAGPEVLIIDPLTAFGAGDHPSTWLNLHLLLRLLQGEWGEPPGPGSWAADVGAGSGVLALALALKGGLRVAAVDPDPASRRAVGLNRRLNPLAGGLVHFLTGDHRALGGQFPLVAANLPGALLRALAPDLAALVAPGGRLVVSGFRDEAGGETAERFLAQGLAEIARAWRHGWEGQLWRQPPGGD